jgi:hypothetical protein
MRAGPIASDAAEAGVGSASGVSPESDFGKAVDSKTSDSQAIVLEGDVATGAETSFVTPGAAGAAGAAAETDLEPITARQLYTQVSLFGMPWTYWTVGIVYGMQGALIYPIFQVVLQSGA